MRACFVEEDWRIDWRDDARFQHLLAEVHSSAAMTEMIPMAQRIHEHVAAKLQLAAAVVAGWKQSGVANTSAQL